MLHDTYHGVLSASSANTVEVAPQFSECVVFGITGTVVTDGCKYLFHVDPTNVNVTTGTMDA